MIIFNPISQPRRFTPTGAEHVYSFTSDNILETDFKFVIDVWADPSETYTKKIARLKVRPNKYGYAHIDVSEIIKSLVKPNIYSWNNALDQMSIDQPSQSSWLGALPRLVNYSNSNAYSETDSSNRFQWFDVEPAYHIREYRVLVGEEYTVNGLPTVFIADDPSVKPTGFRVEPNPFGTYPVIYPGIEWENADGDVTIEWYNSNETTLKGGTSFTGQFTGSYETPTQPLDGDKLLVIDALSTKTYVFVWVEEDIEPVRATGWNFVEIREPNPFNGMFDPSPIIIYPGADNRLFNERTLVGDTSDTPLIENHLFDNRIFYIPVNRSSYSEYPSRIPLVAPFNNKIGITDQQLGTRQFTIYENQPLTFPVLCGDLDFFNEVRSTNLKVYYSNGDTFEYNRGNISAIGGYLSFMAETPYPTDRPLEKRVLWVGYNDVWKDIYDNGKTPVKMELWYSTDENYSVSSELIVMNVRPTTCFQDEPLYLVYLNSYGFWQSITFGAVDINNLNMDTKTFQKSKYNNGENYIRFIDKATEIYDMTGIIDVEAQSDYVDNNDALQYVDCISSPEVYLVRGFNTQYQGGVNTEIIPINITSKSVQYKKGYYEKLKRYTIRFTLDNVFKHRFYL